MADFFDLYEHELSISDRDSKTITRYLECVKKFTGWLQSRPVTAGNAKEFLSYLRDVGYAPSSIRLYYHVLKQFLAFANIDLKLKIRKPKGIHQYHSRADIERIFVQAERGLYHHSPAKRKRNFTTLCFEYNISVETKGNEGCSLRVDKGNPIYNML